MSVEQAFADYLTAQLNGTAPAVVALAGNSMAQLPNSVASIVCLIELKRDVGPLWTASVTIHVSTPAKVAGYDITSHQPLAAKVVRLMEFEPTPEDAEALGHDVAAAALVAALDTLTRAVGYAFTGHFLKTKVDKQDTSMWQTSMELDCSLTML